MNKADVACRNVRDDFVEPSPLIHGEVQLALNKSRLPLVVDLKSQVCQ